MSTIAAQGATQEVESAPAPSTSAEPASRETAEPRPPLIVRIAGRVVWLLSLLGLVGVVVLLVWLRVASEDWWLSTALTYLPRAPYAVPPLLLAVAALFVRPRAVWFNLVTLALILGPVMELRFGSFASTSDPGSADLTLVTCNCQHGRRDLQKIVSEIVPFAPDVVLLQEADHSVDDLLEPFDGFHGVRVGEFVVISRYKVRLLDLCRVESFRRITAIRCEVDAPDGPVTVCNVHLSTARYGFANLRIDSLFTGEGVDQLLDRQRLRDEEARQTAAFALDAARDRPLIVAGDFNTPTSSSLFARHWDRLMSLFDHTGWGYGYTSPCNEHEHWPPNAPWLRIDHILCNSRFEPVSCWVGESDGSDHRLVAARVRRAP
jgi:endonuclease/exonuclease/phosphatase family metal-dependent hydrolase